MDGNSENCSQFEHRDTAEILQGQFQITSIKQASQKSRSLSFCWWKVFTSVCTNCNMSVTVKQSTIKQGMFVINKRNLHSLAPLEHLISNLNHLGEFIKHWNVSLTHKDSDLTWISCNLGIKSFWSSPGSIVVTKWLSFCSKLWHDQNHQESLMKPRWLEFLN